MVFEGFHLLFHPVSVADLVIVVEVIMHISVRDLI